MSCSSWHDIYEVIPISCQRIFQQQWKVDVASNDLHIYIRNVRDLQKPLQQKRVVQFQTTGTWKWKNGFFTWTSSRSVGVSNFSKSFWAPWPRPKVNVLQNGPQVWIWCEIGDEKPLCDPQSPAVWWGNFGFNFFFSTLIRADTSWTCAYKNVFFGFLGMLGVLVVLCTAGNTPESESPEWEGGTTPHPGFQSPPGLWNSFSRESQPKPSFACYWVGG